MPITEQETVKQQAVNGPITGPVHDFNGIHAQEFASAPVSPHASGISPLSPAQPEPSPGRPWHSQLQVPEWPWGARQSPPASRSNVQTLAPVAGSVTRPQVHPQPVVFPPDLPAMAKAPAAAPGRQGGLPTYLLQRKRRNRRRFPIWARVAVGMLLFTLVVVGSVAGYLYFTFAPSVNNIVNQQVPRERGEEDPNASRNGTDILSGPRINILLLGSDTDQKFTNADGSHTYLAQSDIIVSIDPATKSVSMLSIPRDFYISVPGYGMHKLDEAYALGGKAAGNQIYSPGGVALSRLTIERDFGIPINYYAWVGLDGFVKVIDTVGGVDVDVLHPITDDNYPDDVGNHTGDIYALKRVYIPPGPQHLNGMSALEYVRSRHADLVGDFGRSARQQQVLSALRLKLNNAGIVGKLPDIANDLNGYVKTDMQLSDVFKLMNFARGIDPNKINRVILDPPYSQLGTLPGGESVVFPNCAKIVPVIEKMFILGSKAACNIEANSGGNGSVTFHMADQSLPGAIMMMNKLIPVSLSSVNSEQDPFGIHSLLDLLLLTVFDSPQAIQV